MRHLGIGLAALRRRCDEKPVGMIGELTDQTPFFICKFGAPRESSRRLLALTYSRELEGEDAAKLVLGLRVLGEKSIRAIDQNASKLEGLRGKTKHPIAAP